MYTSELPSLLNLPLFCIMRIEDRKTDVTFMTLKEISLYRFVLSTISVSNLYTFSECKAKGLNC